MIPKIKQGTSVPVKFTVMENGEQKDMRTATRLSWSIRHTEYGCRRLPGITVVGGSNPYTIVVNTTAASPLGVYYLALSYDLDGESRAVDASAFELTAHSAACGCQDPDKAICLLADTCIGAPGVSAYEIYKKHHPESTLTESEYADGPVLAAGAANTAAGKANGAAEKALTAAEKADTSTGKATEAAERAEDAAKKAGQSAEAADLATAGAVEAAESADAAAASANGAAESAQKAADKANISAAGADASAKKADTATAEASTAAGAARNAADDATTAAASANAASGKAESAASSANAAAVSANGAASAATTAAGRADKSSATADTAAAGATAAASKADIAAVKADTAAEGIMKLSIVRTDVSQQITAEGQELARGNISAVGALPVALSLSEDNTLSIASALDTLSAHYKLYAANTGAYRWSMILSDASAQVEEVEAEAVLANYVLHLMFHSQVLDQRYDLALSVSDGAVVEASVAWRRTEQAGADTSSGQFVTNITDLNKYDGDRGLEVYFRTGSDVAARQHINSNLPLTLIIEGGRLYVSEWGLRTNDNILPDTYYHVAVAFDKEKQKASLYINGNFVAASVRVAPPAYSTYNMIGCASTGDYPFKGTIYHARLFNYAPRPEDVAVFYNNGYPAGYVVPAEMRGEGNNYKSDFSSGVDRWAANTAETTVVWNSGLEASSESGHIRLRRTFSAAELATTRPHTYAFEVVVEGDPAFSHLQFYAFSVRSYTNVSKKDAEIIDGGLRIRGVVFREEKASFSAICHCILYNAPAGAVVKIRSIKITPLSCIAEYLPGNIIMARRMYFPQVVFPLSIYTASANTFSPNDHDSTNRYYDQPAANGFSGEYMRFEAIRNVSLYCAYWSGYIKEKAPIRVTLEYRSNVSVYQGQVYNDSTKLGDANEGAPKVISYDMTSSTFGSASVSPDAWLEIRVLSIEVAKDVKPKWLDSAKQLPINGGMPPLWSSVGGYDLTASGTPQIVYESGRRENAAVIAEVLAESDCSLEARISRLEKALIALTSGEMFIPKLSVKELAVWGDNNLIVTGAGAPTKAPDRAGQIYIDTKNNAVYHSIGNAAVSDWKNA